MTEITETQTETVEAVENTENVDQVVNDTPSESDTDANEKVEVEKELTVDEKIANAVKEAESRVKSATQKRIDRLTYEARSKEEELQKAMERIDALKPQQEQTPKEDDFETYEAWQDAVVEHKANLKLKELEAEQNQKLALQKQQEALDAGRKRFEAQEAEFRQSNPEYDDNAQKFSNLAAEITQLKGQTPAMQAVGQVLTELDSAPALINHLGQNEELVFDLVEKSPVLAAFELFKLSQELETQTQTTKETLPQPVKPVKANGKAVKSVSQMSGEELLARFAK